MSKGGNMLDHCRRSSDLFCLLLCVLAGLVSQAQSPATTTISDTVYRADGTPAAGTLLISWPTFSTASVFNPDANTLEEYNGTNPQILRVYGTRTDRSEEH